MAAFGFNDKDNYGQAGKGSFFTLKNDKDSARVRFLYKDMNDVEGLSVHRVAVGDKERYVNCLRTYNDPIDKCPFCKAGLKVTPKLFVKLYNEDAKECQLWERGKTFFDKLSGIAMRYNPMHDTIFEIVRNGKPKDMQTTYDIWPTPNTSDFNIDEVTIDEPLGSIVLDKSFDEMEAYLEQGSFPDTASSVAEARTGNGEPEYQRRTPGARAF